VAGSLRLDVLLVRRGLFASREQAAAAVLAGRVRVDGEVARKPGQRVGEGARLEVEGPAHPYASRGGLKLAAALDAFGIDVTGCTCLDVGASTGGFTDVLLRRGARRVYAVDVGYGQLAWRLRNDPRVVVRERTNARHLGEADVPEPVHLAAIDVSFIGLGKVLPAVGARVAAGGAVVALCKPQFEAGPAEVPRGGVVRDPAVHRRVLLAVVAEAAALGWHTWGVIASPVPGARGNREFLVYWRREAPGLPDVEAAVDAAVEGAHAPPAGEPGKDGPKPPARRCAAPRAGSGEAPDTAGSGGRRVPRGGKE
jgi:23S rRNA (cytidine1920-2'-O)/16S rRNA (cytidine1409-2'-O)-methyltransferase